MAIVKMNTALPGESSGDSTKTVVILAVVTIGLWLGYEYWYKPWKAKKDAAEAGEKEAEKK